jgi:hypothetical protein
MAHAVYLDARELVAIIMHNQQSSSHTLNSISTRRLVEIVSLNYRKVLVVSCNRGYSDTVLSKKS